MIEQVKAEVKVKLLQYLPDELAKLERVTRPSGLPTVKMPELSPDDIYTWGASDAQVFSKRAFIVLRNANTQELQAYLTSANKVSDDDHLVDIVCGGSGLKPEMMQRFVERLTSGVKATLLRHVCTTNAGTNTGEVFNVKFGGTQWPDAEEIEGGKSYLASVSSWVFSERTQAKYEVL